MPTLGMRTTNGLSAMAPAAAIDPFVQAQTIFSGADPAILPLVSLMAGVLFFVLTPVFNAETRTQEKEADMFGLNASRQPDGFAQAAIHLGEYRKMHPGPIEEFLFFDHPSGYNRIHSAMVWKSQNLTNKDCPAVTSTSNQ